MDFVHRAVCQEGRSSLLCVRNPEESPVHQRARRGHEDLRSRSQPYVRSVYSVVSAFNGP